jgi:DNA-binding NarL/FixJ family response regulator
VQRKAVLHQLVRAGSSLKASRPQIRLAIGNCDDKAMNEFLVKVVTNAGNGIYEVKLVSSDSIDELAKLGANEEVDVFILIANNLREPLVRRRLHRAVDLVSFLKNICKKPVIVLSGRSDSSFHKGLADAGADAFFWLPYDPKRLVEATRKALSSFLPQ